MTRRGWIIGFFAFSVVLALAALAWHLLGPEESDPWGDRSRPRVVVSLPPLACFVYNVAGPNVSLLCLCTEEGPDVCEATDANAAMLGRADLFLASGLGVDDRLAGELHNKAPRVRFRKLSEGLPAGLGSNKGDPRVWLGLSRAVVLVQRTRDELKAVDPARAADYDRNADRYVAQLRQLEKVGKTEVEKKKDRRIMSVEGPMRHFAENFGLDLVAAVQLKPNDGPGAKAYDEVAGQCLSETGVRVLLAPPGFFESPAAQELYTASKEKKLRVALVKVDTLERAPAADLAAPEWYTHKISDSLARLLKQLP